MAWTNNDGKLCHYDITRDEAVLVDEAYVSRLEEASAALGMQRGLAVRLANLAHKVVQGEFPAQKFYGLHHRLHEILADFEEGRI